MANPTRKFTRMIKGHGLLAAVVAGLVASSGVAMADTTSSAATTTTSTNSTIQTAQLEAQIEALQTKVNQLQAQQNQQNNDATREAQITEVVKQVLSDAQFRSQYMDDQLQAGYNKGFFIQTADQDFKLNINGQLQFRYTYANATNPNNLSQYKPGPTGPAFGLSWDPGLPDTGNVSGFTWRRARIIFSGNVFSPDLFFKVMGDFGSTSSTNNGGNFSMQDLFIGYKFAPWLQVKGGSMLIPFTHVEYISSGLEFPEFNPIVDAYDPVRAQGVSVFGDTKFKSTTVLRPIPQAMMRRLVLQQMAITGRHLPRAGKCSTAPMRQILPANRTSTGPRTSSGCLDLLSCMTLKIPIMNCHPMAAGP